MIGKQRERNEKIWKVIAVLTILAVLAFTVAPLLGTL